MARRAPNLLDTPAHPAVRELAVARLKQVERAFIQLQKAEPEALHDFRVAIRRLRTLLRAYRELKPLKKKWQTRLRVLARATNGARDLEVAVQTLRGYGRRDAGAAQLAARFAVRAQRAKSDTLDEMAARWPPLAEALPARIRSRTSDAEEFGQLTARLAQRQWRRLARRLESLNENWRDETAHRARLAGKRLRYLMEPLIGDLPEAKAAVTALKKFQDRFGAYHDAGALLDLMAEEATLEATTSAPARAPTVTTTPNAGARYDALAERVRKDWTRRGKELRRIYPDPDAEALAAVSKAVEALNNRPARRLNTHL